MNQMGRRTFLASSAASLLLARNSARAQQRLPLIGWLGTQVALTSLPFHQFQQALANAGWLEGREFRLEGHFIGAALGAIEPENQEIVRQLAANLAAGRP